MPTIDRECLEVPRPGWPGGPLTAVALAAVPFAVGLAAGVAGILALDAAGLDAAGPLGLVAAPLGILAGAALSEALWPPWRRVRRVGDEVRVGPLRLPAGVGDLEVAADAGDGRCVVSHVVAGGARRFCAAGWNRGVVAAYAEGLARVGGYGLRWSRRPPPVAPEPFPSRRVSVRRRSPEAVVVRLRGVAWSELVLGSLLVWAGIAAAVSAAYPFALGPLGFGDTLAVWEGAATLLLAAHAAVTVAAPLELVASPSGILRRRRFLGAIGAGRRRLDAAAVGAIFIGRRTRWHVFAATGHGAVDLGRYVLEEDAAAVRRLVRQGLGLDEPERHRVLEPEAPCGGDEAGA